MYKELSEDKTRQHYSELLDETLLMAEKRLAAENTTLWNSVVNQLKDIRVMVIEKQALRDWEEVYDRYTLGSIAAHELSEKDEMNARISDIFWGAVHYRELENKKD